MTAEDSRTLAKKRAGEQAAEFVRDGQVVGLGTGSTAIFAIRAIGRLVAQGLRIKGVPTSAESARAAAQLGIPLIDLNDTCKIDITIDGADQIDSAFTMIKGGGGALLREKLVARVTEREVIVVDPAKLVSRLGEGCVIPIEAVPFGWRLAARLIGELGGTSVLRGHAGQPFVSDNGNYILDCSFGYVKDAPFLDRSIKQLPGVVESGLFVGLAHTLIVGTENGTEVSEYDSNA
jgi:ribose 5-phosphate isomerase A